MSSHEINKKVWAEMDLFTQMGNIGTEVGRAISAKNRGKPEWAKSAFYRAIDLMNLTAELWAVDWPYRTKELLYSRDQLVGYILDDKVDNTLEQYFFQFALAARRNK